MMMMMNYYELSYSLDGRQQTPAALASVKPN